MYMVLYREFDFSYLSINVFVAILSGVKEFLESYLAGVKST